MVRFFSAIIITLLCSTSYGQIYKWTDANGTTHFSDEPPKQGHFDSLTMPTTPTSTSTPAPSSHTNQATKLRQQKVIDSFEQDRQAKEKIQKELAQKKEKLNQTCSEAKTYLQRLNVGGIYNLDKQGNKVYQPESERAQIIERTQHAIKLHCP